jgi:hypothetical protein
VITQYPFTGRTAMKARLIPLMTMRTVCTGWPGVRLTPGCLLA